MHADATEFEDVNLSQIDYDHLRELVMNVCDAAANGVFSFLIDSWDVALRLFIDEQNHFLISRPSNPPLHPLPHLSLLHPQLPGA